MKSRLRVTGRALPLAGLILLAATLVAFNLPALLPKPSYELAVRGTNGEPLRVAKAEQPFKASEIADIKQGEASVIILTEAGDIYTMGDNMFGQLGSGTFGAATMELRRLTLADGVRIKKIDMTHKHALALAENGDVWAWGLNVSGQVGNGTRRDTGTPAKVLTGASDIAAGYRFSAAIRDGELWAWGMQCDPATPGLTELAASFAHDVSIGGSYYDGAGQNDAVYCLEQENLPIDSLKPRRMETVEPARFTAVSGGYGHLLMLDDKQTAWGIGCNGWGQLGRGNAINDGTARRIRKVAMPSGVRLAEIDAGFRHSIARDSDGNVWSWGHDMHGATISYKSNRADTPKQVAFDGKAVRVGAGHGVSGVITADGFYAAGENQQAQISPPDADQNRFALPKFQKIGDNTDIPDRFSLGVLRQYYWRSGD